MIKYLIYSAILVRILTQFSCEFITNESVQGLIYAIGVAYFELVALLVFTKVVIKEDLIINFALGVCIFDLFKFIFLNPFKVGYFEYLNVFLGIIFIFVLWFKKGTKFK